MARCQFSRPLRFEGHIVGAPPWLGSTPLFDGAVARYSTVLAGLAPLSTGFFHPPIERRPFRLIWKPVVLFGSHVVFIQVGPICIGLEIELVIIPIVVSNFLPKLEIFVS